MEKFWNIIYFFAYKFMAKIFRFLMKIDPILNIAYKTDFAKRHFQKMGKDPVKEVSFALTDKRIGQSSFFATFMMQAMPFVFLFGLHNFSFLIFNNRRIPAFEVYIYPLVVYGIISGVLNYLLLFRKDKYLQYFNQFEKQPRRWKVKWGWISTGVILFPFLVLISSFMLMAH